MPVTRPTIRLYDLRNPRETPDSWEMIFIVNYTEILNPDIPGMANFVNRRG